MVSLDKIVLAGACAAFMFACSSTDTTSSGGGTSSGSTGSTAKGSGNASSSGSSGAASGAAPTVSCPSGETDVADQWYGVADCKTYFDTAKTCSCASSADSASCESQFATSMASSLCYPNGMTFSESTAQQACSTALSSYKQANPSCK